MGIEISEAQIQSWIQDGVKNAIHSMMRDRYGQGERIKEAMEKAIKESEPLIVASLKAGIAQACASPAFLQGIEQDLAKALASQYRGAFEGVVRAAAKKAANNEVTANHVAELTQQAVGPKS